MSAKYKAAVLFLCLCLLTACGAKPPEPARQSGQIFLYGENHTSQLQREKEFELWSAYYHDDGMRHLFVELPYYTAEFLNLWMQSDSDELLDELYEDWDGTLAHDQAYLDFYQRIKQECPETIFHGTDVGHQYNTTGERFLEYLSSNGQTDTEQYRLAQENIKQGQRFYQAEDFTYRENRMVENFIREAEALREVGVMGIYGAEHTVMEEEENPVVAWITPPMACQLYEKYGDDLHCVDLTSLVDSGK